MGENHIVEYLFALLDDSGNPVELDEKGQIPVPLFSGEELIPLKEWAERNGLNPATARQKAIRGGFQTARKVGRDWMISSGEINMDHRMRLNGAPQQYLEGPVLVSRVMSYLMELDGNALPEKWARDNSHQDYCKQVYLSLREGMQGNAALLFDLICDAVQSDPGSRVYFISHDKIMENMEDEGWETSNRDSSLNSGITIDFSDYLIVLKNTVEDLLTRYIRLKIRYNGQEIRMPWYQSISWRRRPDDGLYFVPSDFFKTVLYGLEVR